MTLWCEWCHSKTENNSYGNCKSCGAPRSEDVEKEEERRVNSDQSLFFTPHIVACSTDFPLEMEIDKTNSAGIFYKISPPRSIQRSPENSEEVSEGIDLSSGNKDKTVMSLWDNIRQGWQHIVKGENGNKSLRNQDLGWDEDEWE